MLDTIMFVAGYVAMSVGIIAFLATVLILLTGKFKK